MLLHSIIHKYTLCDLLVTHEPYVSTLEMHHDKALHKFTLLCFTSICCI